MATVKAVDGVSHDHMHLARGEQGECSDATAKILADKGLVKIVGVKKAAEPENKMAAPAVNKAAKK